MDDDVDDESDADDDDDDLEGDRGTSIIVVSLYYYYYDMDAVMLLKIDCRWVMRRNEKPSLERFYNSFMVSVLLPSDKVRFFLSYVVISNDKV